MWWFDPSVQRADGNKIPATEVTENPCWAAVAAVGAALQRRSVAARDRLSGDLPYLALIRKELRRCVEPERVISLPGVRFASG